MLPPDALKGEPITWQPTAVRGLTPDHKDGGEVELRALHHSEREPLQPSGGMRSDAVSGGREASHAETSTSCATAQEPRSWLRWAQDRRVKTTVLINLTAIMERTDEQLLPAVYRFVAISFAATPSQLGYLTLSRALVQAVASPLGGFLGHYYNRIYVTAAGCLIWGAMTALFSFSTSVTQGYALWAINGIGLSMVIPNGQSLTADYYSEASRGAAFGALYLTGAVGAMLGALFATNLGHTHPLGLEGWRFAFLVVAIMSLCIGLLTLAFGSDPRFDQPWRLRAVKDEDESFGSVLKEMRSMFVIPTFLIIILQGVVGSTPWNALVFLTLYLQLLGMSDFTASLLMAVFLGGSAAGGLLGGWVGDKAASRHPRHGRIFVVQFSVLSGVPLSFVLLKGLSYDGSNVTVALYALTLVSMGLLISWAAPACNNPLFAEIVPPQFRTMIYAFDRSFEGALAACAAPVVGILAEKIFGFSGTAAAGTASGVSADTKKAAALGNALLLCMTVPWFLCAVFYSGLHYTYPRDKEAAQRLAAALSARQRDESEALARGITNGYDEERGDAIGLITPDSDGDVTSPGGKGKEPAGPDKVDRQGEESSDDEEGHRQNGERQGMLAGARSDDPH